MDSNNGLPSWQWVDYGALNAAQNKSTPAPASEDAGKNKNFGSDIVNQAPAKFIVHLMTDEFGSLIMDNIQFYVAAAIRGINYFKASIFKSIRGKDLRIGGLLQTRKSDILNEKYSINVKKWDEGKKYIEDIFEDIKGKLYDFFSACVEANMQGIKMFEVNYKYDNGVTTIDSIRPIDNTLYLYDADTREYSLLDTSKMSIYDIRSKAIQNLFIDVKDLPKQEIHPMKLIVVHGLDGDDENSLMNGFDQALAYAFFYKSYNWKDLQIYIERFASPLMDISYDSVNESVKADAVRIAKTAKAHGYVIRPKDALTFAYIESQNKTDTVDVFMKPIEYQDTEMSIRVKGEADTTNKMGKNGSRAGLQVKKAISDAVKNMDLKVIITGGNALIKNLIDLKFPNPPEYPTLQFVSMASVEDQKTESETLKNISDSGFDVDPSEVSEKFNYKNVVKKAATAPAQNEPPANNDGKTNASRYNMSNVDLYIEDMKKDKSNLN